MKFCSECGNELRDEAVMCPKCGEEVVSIPLQRPQNNKKFCTYCGAEVLSAAIICPKCGCPSKHETKRQTVTDYPVEITKNSSGLRTATKVFMIISCFLPILVSCILATRLAVILEILDVAGVNSTSLELDIVYLAYSISIVLCLLPFSWVIPMTTYYFKVTNRGEKVGIVFKIFTLLFVNLIAGILMLCDTKNIQ